MTGPGDLILTELAEILADVLERPLAVTLVSLGTYRASAQRYGANEAFAQGLVDIAAAQKPTGVRAWAADVLRPAVQAANSGMER